MNKALSGEKRHQIWLFAILLIGAFLRFYNYSSISLTGDELASLLMLQGRTLSELIEEGIRPDFHPAFFQVLLYYWVKLFGITEASIRIPFVVAGILAILFSYLLASQWFNKTTGLFVAASICFLQFPLIHSQIARPYSLGLCFCLMAAWFWTLVLFKPKPFTALKIIGYSVSTALCMYTHYFSFFLAMIMAITGLFFINKDTGKRVLISALLIIVLFLPHFSISLGHLTIGGFGETGWLGAPNLHGNWFWQYLLFCFNNSIFLLFFFFGIGVITVLLNYRIIRFNKFHLLSILWFLTPFFVGYYYSIYSKPVLQITCLLFSFPFLLILLFSFIKNEGWSVRKDILLALFLSTGLFSTVILQRFYQTNHFGVLKEIVQKSIHYLDKYGDEKVTKTVNVGLSYFIEYYMDRYDQKIDFIPYNIEEEEDQLFVNNGRQDLKIFVDIVNKSQTPYFLYAWSSKYSPHEIPQIIMDKYPYMLERDYYFNAEVYLFAHEIQFQERDNSIGEDIIFQTGFGFEESSEEWVGSETGISHDIASQGEKSFLFTEETEFSSTYSIKIGEVFNANDNILNTSVWGYFQEVSDEAILVITLESNGKVYEWRGMNFSYFIKEVETWTKVYHSWRFHYIKSRDDILKVYVWNSNKRKFYIDDIQIKITEGNPILYNSTDRSL